MSVDQNMKTSSNGFETGDAVGCSQDHTTQKPSAFQRNVSSSSLDSYDSLADAELARADDSAIVAPLSQRDSRVMTSVGSTGLGSSQLLDSVTDEDYVHVSTDEKKQAPRDNSALTESLIETQEFDSDNSDTESDIVKIDPSNSSHDEAGELPEYMGFVKVTPNRMLDEKTNDGILELNKRVKGQGNKIRKLSDDLFIKEHRIDRLNKKINRMKKELRRACLRGEENRSYAIHLKQQLDAANFELEAQKALVTAKENEGRRLLEDQERQFGERIGQYETDLAKARLCQAEKGEKIQSLELRFLECESKRRRLETEFASLDDQLTKVKESHTVTDAKQKTLIEELDAKKSKLESELEAYKLKYHSEMDDLEVKLADEEKLKKDAEVRLDELKKKYGQDVLQLKVALREKEAELARLDDQLTKVRESHTDTDAKQKTLIEKLDTKKSKLESELEAYKLKYHSQMDDLEVRLADEEKLKKDAEVRLDELKKKYGEEALFN